MTDSLRYRDLAHESLPHVVKFSGGRSSAMMLLTLAEIGALRLERGDVVVFNNTSAEHPATYQFVRDCKERIERAHAVPVLMIEFATYEDSWRGEWTRLPTYRLVNANPRSESNPDGYHHRGEVFREMVSYKAILPNQFRRVCTSGLKLEPARRFLKDWLGGHPKLKARGIQSDHSLVETGRAYDRYRRNGGRSPRAIYDAKRAYALSRPGFRPAQRYADYTTAYAPHKNAGVYEYVFGSRAALGKGVDYVSLIGLRADEPGRVRAVEARASNPHARGDEAGEIVYSPLADMGIEIEDVADFWAKRDFDLGLDPADNLGNCTYCFLKGPSVLREIRDRIGANGDAGGTPIDIRWWSDLEREYGRDLDAESGGRTSPDGHGSVGFFGATELSYATIETATENTRLSAWASQPCICTN